MKSSKNLRIADPALQQQTFIENNLNILCCRYWALDLWDCYDMAFPFWRIYWNKNKGGVLTYLEKDIDMNPDYMYLIAPFTSFSSHIEKKSRFSNGIHVSGRSIINSDNVDELRKDSLIHFFLHFNIGIPFDNVLPNIFEIEINDIFKTKLEYITGQLKHNNSEFKMTSSLRIQSFIFETLSHMGPKLWKTINIDSRILEVIRFVENNIDEKHRNTTLAKMINMAPNSFSRLFKNNTGITPLHFLHKRKITRACKLFENSNKTIEDVAFTLGFSDRYHFTRVFTSITGVSPGVYRSRVFK